MRLSEDQFRAIWQSAAHDQAIGHGHFWERAVSRRKFLGTAAAASGVAVTASLWMPGLAKAALLVRGRPDLSRARSRQGHHSISSSRAPARSPRPSPTSMVLSPLPISKAPGPGLEAASLLGLICVS